MLDTKKKSPPVSTPIAKPTAAPAVAAGPVSFQLATRVSDLPVHAPDMPETGVGPELPGAPDDLRSRLDTGHAMDGALRSRMERHFGESFVDVRLHTGHAAADVSRSFSARAFTIGSDIGFDA